MTETARAQAKAARREIQEISQWLDWATEVAGRIETRLTEIEAETSGEDLGQAPSQPTEAEGPMSFLDGVIAYNVTDYQAAIDGAGRAFWKQQGKPPVWVALPGGVDPASLELWTLRRSDRPAPPGTVIVGGEIASGS
jgi:hypothetical protein